MLQTEATYKAEIINTAEQLNTKHKDDLFINIFKNHKSNQTTVNSTINTSAKIVEELNQTNNHWYKKAKVYYESLYRKIGKQSNVWPEY